MSARRPAPPVRLEGSRPPERGTGGSAPACRRRTHAARQLPLRPCLRGAGPPGLARGEQRTGCPASEAPRKLFVGGGSAGRSARWPAAAHRGLFYAAHGSPTESASCVLGGDRSCRDRRDPARPAGPESSLAALAARPVPGGSPPRPPGRERDHHSGWDVRVGPRGADPDTGFRTGRIGRDPSPWTRPRRSRARTSPSSHRSRRPPPARAARSSTRRRGRRGCRST